LSSLRLSICIATLNRADVIGETLSCLVPELGPETELLILDGASTDRTSEVVAEYAATNVSVRYLKKDKASGVDRDFDEAVEQARGDYCWLMSDDDLLQPGAIGTILRAIRSEPSLILVNAQVRTPDFSEVLVPRMLRITENETYAPGEMERLLVDTGSYLTFIGCVVIRRQLWLERDRASYYGSLFIHAGVIFQSPLPSSVIVIAEPFIWIRYGMAMWSARGFEIWMFKWPGLIWSLPGYSDAAKARVTPMEPWRKATTLALYRAKGLFSWPQYRQWIAPRASPVWFRAIACAIAIAPCTIVNAAASLYLRLLMPNPELPLFELKASQHHYSRLRTRTKQ
jgi:abequosyltransferase